MDIMNITKKVVKWHGTNGISLYMLKSKSNSHLGVKKKFGPKTRGKQGELWGCACSKCIPKG
jgi:hypothetical protein